MLIFSMRLTESERIIPPQVLRASDDVLPSCLESHWGKNMGLIDDSSELHWATVFQCWYPKVTARTNGTNGMTWEKKESVEATRQEDK